MLFLLSREFFIEVVAFSLLHFLGDVNASPVSQNSYDLPFTLYGSTVDTEPVDDLSNSHLRNLVVDSNSKLPNAGCTSDVSTHFRDQNFVLKNKNSCPAEPVTAEVEFPAWVKELLKLVKADSNAEKHSTPNDVCKEYAGRPVAVSCAGPEVDANFDYIPFVIDCVLGMFFESFDVLLS